MDSCEGKTSDTAPLLTREQIPAGPLASITDHESSALREGAEGGVKTSEPPAACAPVTTRGGEDLKVRIATSVRQARQLLQQVKQEPESVADSQGGGNAATRGRTADHLLRQQRQGRQPAVAAQAAGAGYGSLYNSPLQQQHQPRAANQPTAQRSAARIVLVAFPTTQQPRAFQQRELWRAPGGAPVPQPESGRIVIGGVRSRGAVSYTYAEDLPCCIYMCAILAVILVIIATPLSLVGTIPAVICMRKAHREVGNGNVRAARIRYTFSVVLMILSFFIGVMLTAIVVPLGVLFGLQDDDK